MKLPNQNGYNESMSERTKVVGYVRVSTAQQADGGVSLDAQRAKLEAYAVALDLDLVRVEVDAGVSAKGLDRPALQAALAHLDAGEADGLLVAKLDRLTRSVRDLGWLVESSRFGERWSLLSVADSIDTRTAGGRLVLNVLVSVSQWEREAIGERTRDALHHVRAEGAKLGGEALGWTRSDETDKHGRRVVVHDGREAGTIARAVELRDQGHTWRDVAARLTAEGHRTKRGGRWHANTARRVVLRAESDAGTAAA
ncbi:MAG: recombinase family protein [Polyangiaceae bacterium]